MRMLRWLCAVVNLCRSWAALVQSSILCKFWAISTLADCFGTLLLSLRHRIPVEERPTLVLRAEEELGITAGLQDRVIQVYGGVVYMDFAKEFIQQHGHSRYRGCTAITTMLYVHILATCVHSLRLSFQVRWRWAPRSWRRSAIERASSFPASTHALPPVILCWILWSSGCPDEEVSSLQGHQLTAWLTLFAGMSP